MTPTSVNMKKLPNKAMLTLVKNTLKHLNNQNSIDTLSCFEGQELTPGLR